jgi:hypothetical protein
VNLKKTTKRILIEMLILIVNETSKSIITYFASINFEFSQITFAMIRIFPGEPPSANLRPPPMEEKEAVDKVSRVCNLTHVEARTLLEENNWDIEKSIAANYGERSAGGAGDSGAGDRGGAGSSTGGGGSRWGQVREAVRKRKYSGGGNSPYADGFESVSKRRGSDDGGDSGERGRSAKERTKKNMSRLRSKVRAVGAFAGAKSRRGSHCERD